MCMGSAWLVYFTIYLHPGLIVLNCTSGPILSKFVGFLSWGLHLIIVKLTFTEISTHVKTLSVYTNVSSY